VVGKGRLVYWEGKGRFSAVEDCRQKEGREKGASFSASHRREEGAETTRFAQPGKKRKRAQPGLARDEGFEKRCQIEAFIVSGFLRVRRKGRHPGRRKRSEKGGKSEGESRSGARLMGEKTSIATLFPSDEGSSNAELSCGGRKALIVLFLYAGGKKRVVLFPGFSKGNKDTRAVSSCWWGEGTSKKWGRRLA